MKKLSMILFGVLCVFCFAHGAYYFPQLPDTVASHFSLSGQPDATMSKTAMLGVYYAVVAGLFGLIFLSTHLTSRMAPEGLNLPNKAYWMSKEREPQTRAFLSSHLLWLGSASMLMVLYVFHQSFRVTLGLTERLPRMPWVLGVFLGFVFLACLGLFARFARVGGTPSPITSEE